MDKVVFGRLIALHLVITSVVTPALTSAVTICRCADHETAHVPPPLRTVSCHNEAQEAEPSSDENAFAFRRSACCDERLGQLVPLPATIELRAQSVTPSSAAAMPVEACVLQRSLIQATPNDARAPPRASLHQFNCVMLI